MANDNDTTIIGDELTAAHTSFSKGLNTYANFKLNDRELGENLVQDTFTKTWIYLVKGGKVDIMKAFLYHVLNNLIIDQYRKSNQKTASLDVLLEKGFEPSSEESENKIIDIIDGRTASKLIKKLPFLYRAAMTMKFMKNMTLKEISAKTGQTKNSIAVQISRGLVKLRDIYDGKIAIIKK